MSAETTCRERLQAACTARGFDFDHLCKMLHVSAVMLRANDGYVPAELLARAALILRVNFLWLLTSEGPMDGPSTEPFPNRSEAASIAAPHVHPRAIESVLSEDGSVLGPLSVYEWILRIHAYDLLFRGVPK